MWEATPLKFDGHTIEIDAERLTVDGAPIVVWGPGTPAVMHAVDEYVELAELEQAATAFGDVVGRWAG